MIRPPGYIYDIRDVPMTRDARQTNGLEWILAFLEKGTLIMTDIKYYNHETQVQLVNQTETIPS